MYRRKCDNGNNVDSFNENQTCPTVGYQAASVCVPVTVTPFASAGATVTKCCGAATVVSNCEDGCRLLVIQRLKVRFPVCYKAEVIPEKSETVCTEDC